MTAIRERFTKGGKQKMCVDELSEIVNTLFQLKQYDAVKEVLLKCQELTVRDNDLSTLFHLFPIYEQEKEAGKTTLFEKVSSVDQLLYRYTMIKFFLRRLEYGGIEPDPELIRQFRTENDISDEELRGILAFSCYHKKRVTGYLWGSEAQNHG